MAKIFIGVSWPYANGPLHVGGVSSSYLPPDIFARYHRMKGDQVLMVSGSDMHGTPITVTAEKEGVAPEVVAERYHELNSKSLKNLGVTFDLFTHTSHENHKKVVIELFNKLHENGYIYEKTMLSAYCSQCNRFLPDRYVLGECPHCKYPDARGDQCDECGKPLDPEELGSPRCRICSSKPEMRETKHMFFKLSAFEDKLLDYIKDKNYWKTNTLKFTKNWLESGLLDRPVTRDIHWGIDVPFESYEGKKIYVWFEAVMGYFSASKQYSQKRGDVRYWESFWKNDECRHYYFIGKDNIPFHTIIWPAMLMGIGGLNLPYDVPANEHMRLGKEKFSKSRGVLVDIPSILEKYDPDAVRYYISTIIPEHRDAEFSWSEFYRKNNDELVATYGNFVNRVLTFAQKHFEAVPKAEELGEIDKRYLERSNELIEELSNNLEKCRFQAGIKNIMMLAALGNKYIDEKAPWSQIKIDRDACATTLNVAIQLVKRLAIVTMPYLPFSAQRLWNMLGFEGNVHEQYWDEAFNDLPVGQKFGKIEPLFEKLALVEDEASEFDEDLRSLPICVRVANVLKVKNHPNAEKLYVLEVSLGDETRTLVAGLKNYYRPQELEDKNIAVLCNLKPAKLRGVESKGMLLAAEDDRNVGVLYIEDADPGIVILGDSSSPEISINEFQKYKLEVVELEEPEGAKGVSVTLANGKKVVLSVDKKPVLVDKDIKPGSKIR